MLYCVRESCKWQCIQKAIQSGGEDLESECATNLFEGQILLIILIHNFKVEKQNHLNSGIPEWQWSAFQVQVTQFSQ